MIRPFRWALPTLLCGLAACTTAPTDPIRYKSAAPRPVATLDLPPDVAQLARGNEYVVQRGGVSANGLRAAAPDTPRAPATAQTRIGDVRLEVAGTQRWLVVGRTPESLWTPVRDFWQESGFLIDTDRQEAGVMETDWAETHAQLPQGFVRGMLGKVMDSSHVTGELDRFRTRMERTPEGTEIFVSHRGMVETYGAPGKDATGWRARPTDPGLEAEYLRRLMARLGGAEPAATQRTAAAANAIPAAPRTAVVDGRTVLRIDADFARAWSQVGAALDHTGFTVEERDRAAGFYRVRYVTPRSDRDEPGLFAKLVGLGRAPATPAPLRFRIAVRGEGDATLVSVLDAVGAADAGEDARRIAAVIADDLR